MKKPPCKCEVAFSQKCLVGHTESSVSLDQVNLLDARPERELERIYNPSAPATEEDLRDFFREMTSLLNDSHGKATK